MKKEKLTNKKEENIDKKKDSLQEEYFEEKVSRDQIILTICGVIILPLTIMFILWIFNLPEKTNSTLYRLNSNTFNINYIALDRISAKKLITHKKNRFHPEIINMIKRNKIVIIMNSPEIEILEKDSHITMIKIIKGKYSGYKGWVPIESITKCQ